MWISDIERVVRCLGRVGEVGLADLEEISGRGLDIAWVVGGIFCEVVQVANEAEAGWSLCGEAGEPRMQLSRGGIVENSQWFFKNTGARSVL